MPVAQISGKRILYGILNWGLGHATRSSVLIDRLLKQNNQVTVVSAGPALAFLQQRFPQLVFHEMPSREILYPSHRYLWVKLLLQQQKVFGNISAEQKTAVSLSRGPKPDLIVSDNCYGFYQHNITSVILTHQVNIRAPFLEKAAQKKVHRLLLPFHEIWVPDLEGEKNLSGKLSRPALPGKTTRYIGPLSVLHEVQPLPAVYEYCAIVSGPEKQRTLFEQSVITFLKQQQKPAVLIRGTAAPRPALEIPPYLKVIDICPAAQLRAVTACSNMVIGRTGYSTIMDMYCLQKPCLLLPTPGQTEQEYLFAKHFGKDPRQLPDLSPRLISPCKE